MRSSSQDADEGIDEVTVQFEQFGINERPSGSFSSMEQNVSTRHTNDGSVTKTVSTYSRSETTTGTTIDWQNRPKVHKSVNDDWAKMQGYVWSISLHSKLYAQLRRDMIFFYKGQREQQSDMSPSIETLKLPEHHCRRFERFDFGWKHEDETYMLRCLYQDELEKWVRAINHNIERRNNPTSHIHGALTRVEYPLSVKENADSSSEWEVVDERKTESSDSDTTYKAKPASIESNDFNDQQHSSSTSSHFHKSNNHGTCYEESTGVRNTTIETKLSDTLDLVPDQKQVKIEERSAVAKFNFEEETPIISNKEYQKNADVHLSHAEPQNLRREDFQAKSENSEDSHYMEASNVEGQVRLEGYNSNGEYKQMHCYGILRGQILNFYHVGEQMSRDPIYSIKLKSGCCVSCPSEAERQTWFRLLDQDSELRFLFKSPAEKSKWMNEIAHAISRLDKDEPRRSDSPPVPAVEPRKDSRTESEIRESIPVEMNSRQSTTTLSENVTPTPCASPEASRAVYDRAQSHGYNYHKEEHKENRFKINSSELVQETASNFSLGSTDPEEEISLKDVNKLETSTEQGMDDRENNTNLPVLLEGHAHVTKIYPSGPSTGYNYFITLRGEMLQFFFNHNYLYPTSKENLRVGCFVENICCESDSEYHAFKLTLPEYFLGAILFRFPTEQEKTEWLQTIQKIIQDCEKTENLPINNIEADRENVTDREPPVMDSKSLPETSGSTSPLSPGASSTHKEKEKKELEIAKAKVLSWAQEITDMYKFVDVQDFDKSWKDGRALMALMHALSNGVVNFHARKEVSDDELTYALDVAANLCKSKGDEFHINDFKSGRGGRIFKFLQLLYEKANKPQDTEKTVPKAVRKVAEPVLTKEESDRKNLLNWCRKKVSNIVSLEVNDFTSSWVDGRVLSGIIHSMRPEFVDPDSITRKGDYESINLTLDMFEQLTGIKIDIRVEQILSGNEDKIINLAQTLKEYEQNIFGEQVDDVADEQVEQTLSQCPPGFERCKKCQHVEIIPERVTKTFKCMDCKAMYCRECGLDWYDHFDYTSCEEANAALNQKA